MLYWDSSALVSVILNESSAGLLRSLIVEDSTIASSFITPLEIVSSLWRRRHAGALSADEMHAAEQRFASLTRDWIDAGDAGAITTAMRLVSRHPLRTGDAIQLASATDLVATHGVAFDFVTLDRRLASAARAEGFRVLP